MKNKVTLNTARTDNGYSCNCHLIPGWIVACSGDFEQFKKEVQESINFYVSCAKADGDTYPAIFDEDYELEFIFLR